MCLFANVHIAGVVCNKTNEKYKMMKFDVIEKYFILIFRPRNTILETLSIY